MKGRSGFSLVEILAVLGIIVVLLAVSLPSFLGQGKAANLRLAADQLQGELLLARQQALTMNGQVEFRFFQNEDGDDFTAYQSFQIQDDGTVTPVSKVKAFPENVAVPDEEAFRPLLEKQGDGSNTGTQAGYGWDEEKQFVSIRFRANGELNGMTRKDCFVILVDSQKPRNAGVLPDNYALVAIQPVTGNVTVTQP